MLPLQKCKKKYRLVFGPGVTQARLIDIETGHVSRLVSVRVDQEKDGIGIVTVGLFLPEVEIITELPAPPDEGE